MIVSALEWDREKQEGVVDSRGAVDQKERFYRPQTLSFADFVFIPRVLCYLFINALNYQVKTPGYKLGVCLLIASLQGEMSHMSYQHLQSVLKNGEAVNVCNARGREFQKQGAERPPLLGKGELSVICVTVEIYVVFSEELTKREDVADE